MPGGDGAIRKGMRKEQIRERIRETEQESRRIVAGGLAMPGRCYPCAQKRFLSSLHLAVGSGLGLAFATLSHTAILGSKFIHASQGLHLNLRLVAKSIAAKVLSPSQAVPGPGSRPKVTVKPATGTYFNDIWHKFLFPGIRVFKFMLPSWLIPVA